MRLALFRFNRGIDGQAAGGPVSSLHASVAAASVEAQEVRTLHRDASPPDGIVEDVSIIRR
jgi:hypothetical protein